MRFPSEQIEELFSLQKSDELRMWWEMVYDIAAAKRQQPDKPAASRCLKAVAKRYGLYFLNLDSRMKAAIMPLIQADPAALAEAGLYPAKRTTCGLADAMADLFNAWLWAEQVREREAN